jgi:hypothetical protein
MNRLSLFSMLLDVFLPFSSLGSIIFAGIDPSLLISLCACYSICSSSHPNSIVSCLTFQSRSRFCPCTFCILLCATVTGSSSCWTESRIASFVCGTLSSHLQCIPSSPSLWQDITFNAITIQITLWSQVASSALSFAPIWFSESFD